MFRWGSRLYFHGSEILLRKCNRKYLEVFIDAKKIISPELEAIRERAKADMAGRTGQERKVKSGWYGNLRHCGGSRYSVIKSMFWLKRFVLANSGCGGHDDRLYPVFAAWSRSLRLLNRTVNALLMSKWMRPKTR